MMENKEKRTIKKITRWDIAFIIIVCVQMIVITLIFGFGKQGYHFDEMSNYGFSNSHTQTNLWTDLTKQTNINEWIPASVLHSYITVDKGHQFDYVSVYKNAAGDLNPPLQYFILHTISSFFPGVFSRWFCFVINIAAFIITQWYLYRLVNRMTESKLAGIAAVVLFGFGGGALNITIFLRLYALGIAFSTMFTFYSHEIFCLQREKASYRKPLIMAGVSCLLACFTLHIFLVYAFALVLCYVLWYLFSGKIKLFFQYGLICLTTVGLSFLIFPTTSTHVFSNSSESIYAIIKYPFKWQIRWYAHFITQDLFGWAIDIWPNPTIPYIGYGILITIFFLIPICFLTRKEKWFHFLLNKAKEMGQDIKTKSHRFNCTCVAMAVAIVFMLLMIAYKTSVYKMGIYCSRYQFISYPILAALLVTLVYDLIVWHIKNQKTIAVFLIGVSAMFGLISLSVNLFEVSSPYLFRHEEGTVSLQTMEEDANCIVLLDSAESINILASELGHIQSVFVTDLSGYNKADYTKGLADSGPLYLIVHEDFSAALTQQQIEKRANDTYDVGEIQLSAQSSDVEALKYFYQQDFVDRITFVGYDELFRRQVHIYKIN